MSDDIDMGTEAEAEVALLALVNEWIYLRRPLMAPKAEHRKNEIREAEVRFRLANAAAHWAYFKRDPQEVVSARQAADKAREAGS